MHETIATFITVLETHGVIESSTRGEHPTRGPDRALAFPAGTLDRADTELVAA
jgi:hypothetical protein